jgi:hypothetical protein
MPGKRLELRIQKSLSQALIKKAKRTPILLPTLHPAVPPTLLLDQSIYRVAALKAATFFYSRALPSNKILNFVNDSNCDIAAKGHKNKKQLSVMLGDYNH